MLLVVLMLGQMMPINTLAEAGWNKVVSNEARGAEYVKVTFQYPIYQMDENGEESISSYGMIVEQLVKKGEPPVQPNIPDLTGRRFTGWKDETGSSLDVNAPVQKDTVFRAAYSRLEKRTVTIHYVFDVDDSMALEPYVAEFTAGTNVDIEVKSPALTGFVPGQESVKVEIPDIQEDAEYTVRYTGAPTYYTVRYHFQNVTDNQYTEGGFYRDPVHDHTQDEGLTNGWIEVGPYKIETYPEGTEHAGQPVIAGGMTEVRSFDIEGFVQQDIVQRRVLPDGKTVVDVYYDRELYTYTVDNDGGTAVDSRSLRYGSSLGLPEPSEMERPGYEFVGFFSKNYKFENGKWVETEGEQQHNSKCKMPPYDFTIEVRWRPVQRADYKVVYWVQSVKDAYNAPSEKKTYDFLRADTFTGTVGQKPTVNKVHPQENGLNRTFFELNAERSEIGGIQGNGWAGYYAESTKEIAPDGSTVINVYFDRQTVKLEFGHYEGNWNRREWVVDHERTGLYGQSWRDAGYVEDGWPAGMWRDDGNAGNTNWSYMDGFNHEDLSATSVRFEKVNGAGRTVEQYIEALDSTPENRKWELADHMEDFISGDFNLTSKFLPGFSLYGYSTDNSSEIKTSWRGSISFRNEIRVYNTRNSFTLTFGNCADGSMPEQTYKYEEVLLEPKAVPQRPDNVEADWEFKGWYLDAAGQVPVAWGTQTMPAANMVVYAKWAPPTYTVTYVDVRRNTVDTTQEVITHPFEAEKFGTIMGPELEALEKQYVVDKTKYVDETDRLTYTFLGWFIDENATVRWKPATPITADREVYAKWEPSGTVWYRYVFMGMGDGETRELGKWPETPFEETVWPDRPYGTFAEAAEDFANAGMTDFPEFEGWRPMSTLATTRERLTEQYQEIPVYYVPTSTWPLTIHYVDEETGKSVSSDELHDLTEYAKVYSYRRVEGYKLTSAPQIRVTKDDAQEADGRVHITFKYRKLSPLPYRVEYYQQNLNGGYDLLPDETVYYTEETSRWYLGQTAQVQTADYKTFTGFTRNDNHADAVESVILREDQDNVLRLYYDRNSYTVTYIYGNEKPEKAPDVPEQKSYLYGQTVTVADKPTADGYVFNGWYAFTEGTPDSGSFAMPAMDVVFQGNWGADTDTAYQVHFFFQNEDGSYPAETSYRVTRNGVTDTQVSVTEKDKADKRLGGSLLYRFDADAQNVLEGTIAADGTLVLKLYFKRVTANYTVHHYLDGTAVKVAEDETLSAQVGERVTGKPATAFLDGFAEAQVSRAEPVNATITVGEDASQNVVTFYYRMPITLKANDAGKTYDGTALRESGFAVVNPQNLVNGDKAEDITLAMTGDSSIIMPGTEPNEIDAATIQFNGKAIPDYYTITLQEGVLTIVQRLNVTKTVTIPEILPGESGTALEPTTFSFTLSKDGQPVANARYTAGNRTDTTDGSGVFTLNAGETATFTALELGEYTVVESYNGDWLPEGDGLLTRRATLAASGAGDVRVSFNNRRVMGADVTLTKVWKDGNGTAAQRPKELNLELIGKVGEETVYTAPVTLTGENNWTLKLNGGLPNTLNGQPIRYSLIETDVPDGYTASMDGLTVTNTVTTRNDLTITGVKTWVDGERKHDNAADLTLTLSRRVNNGPWSVFNPGQENFAWADDMYTFSNLPSHDADGYAYDYRVTETVKIPNAHYAVGYTDGKGQPNDGIASFENGIATVNLTNTIVDDNDRYVYGVKTWVDGGRVHDNAKELTLTLTRTSAKQDAQPETVEAAPAWEGNTYAFTGLERYDAEGYAYTYEVTEAPVEGYTTVRTATQNGYDFTNTIQQEKRTVTGEKIWTDGAENHTADQIALTLYRQSNSGEWAKVEAEPDWKDWTYTFADLDRYDANGYEYAYRVEESTVLTGYAATYAPENGVAVFENNAATVNVTNTPQTERIAVWKRWSDQKIVDDQPVDNFYGLRPDDLTVTLTSQPNPNHPDGKSYTYTVSGETWDKSLPMGMWRANGNDGLEVRTHDEFGDPITYVATEPDVPYYSMVSGSRVEITPAAPDHEGIRLINSLAPFDVLVFKEWQDRGWESLRPGEVTFELSNTAFDFKPQRRKLPADQDSVSFEMVPESDAYQIREIMGDSKYVYDTTIEKKDFPYLQWIDVTNTLKLVGDDGRLTVTKTWDDKGGDPKNRPSVSFQLLNGDGTPVKKEGQDWVVPLDTATNTAVFENVPMRTDGYIVKELIDSATNTYGYEADEEQVIVPADGTTAAFTNTRTIATVTVTKQIVDTTADSAAGLAQKFSFEVNGESSLPVGNGESASFEVKIGQEFELNEYDAKGNPLPAGVWNTTGTGKHTATEAQLDIDVTNTRALYDGDGDVTVTKTWLDGDSKPLVDALIPEQLGVKLYEGANVTDRSATLNRENGWKATWSNLPACAVDGTELVYGVKETVDGVDYGDEDAVKIGKREFAVSINGFAITNTLKNSEPTKPEKTADEESQGGVQADDLVTYTIRRTSHLATTTTATVTDKLPKGLDFVRTDSVKVNGEERNLKATVQDDTATWTIQNVPPMGTIEVVFTARVTEQAYSSIQNQATVDLGDKSDSQFESNVEEIPVPRFLLSKSARLPEGKDKAALGDAIEYTLVMENVGDLPLKNVIIRDMMFQLAEDFDIGDIKIGDRPVMASEYVEGDIEIRLARDLVPGQVLTATYRVIVTEEDILKGTVDNTARANAKFGEGKAMPEQEATTSTPTEPKKGHLKVEKRTVSQPKDEKGYVLGETIRYEIVVTNDGNLTITDIRVTDSLSSAEDKVIGTIKGRFMSLHGKLG